MSNFDQLLIEIKSGTSHPSGLYLFTLQKENGVLLPKLVFNIIIYLLDIGLECVALDNGFCVCEG